MADDDDTAIGRYEWERLVKRATMNPSAKLVALTLATYASKDGQHMYPGVEKLAAVTGLTGKTVRAALKTLRADLGLLERTFDGSKNGRRGLADEYRLRRPHDLESRTHMLDPGESTAAIACHEGCQHPGTPELSSGDKSSEATPDESEQGNSVPGTGEVSSRTGEVSSPNTGTEFPPPSHDHPRNQPLNQRGDHLRDATTRGDDGLTDEERLAKLIQFDELAARRRGA